MPRLVVVGSTNIDLTFRAPRLPRPGETLAASSLHVGHGGKGANQAVLAARLGAQVVMVSAVGADDFGRQALDNYRAHGVDSRCVRIVPDQPTGTAAILVDDAANNCILVVAGANATLHTGDVQAAAADIATADAVLAQLETPVAAAVQAFRLARASGVRTLLNPAPALVLPVELLELTDLIIPNETELATLTHLPVDSLSEAEDAASSLRQRGPRAVLVTLGARGALLVTDRGTRYIRPFPIQAVDPTAAGDAFIGSLAVYLAEGAPLSHAARQASAVAALTVTRAGAQDSFPSQAEVAAFLADQQVPADDQEP